MYHIPSLATIQEYSDMSSSKPCKLKKIVSYFRLCLKVIKLANLIYNHSIENKIGHRLPSGVNQIHVHT